MTIKTSNITLVFQGAAKAYTAPGGESLLQYVKRTRAVLPNAHVILSTWQGSELPKGLAVDEVVYSTDPGGLPGIKFDDKINNINRQIVSTRAGMDAVKTPFALKLRTDTFLEHAGFLEHYAKYGAKKRIAASSFFTIDPMVFEQMPFHVSDWFQFGPTDSLQSYWHAPLMTKADANHYDSAKHAAHSTYFDRKFRVRWAVEQYIAAHYARSLGYTTPDFHNDIRSGVIADHQRFLAEQILILDPWQIGLMFPKYQWTLKSRFQSMNCIMFADWYANYAKETKLDSLDSPLINLAAGRLKAKTRLRLGSRLVDPVGRWFYSRQMDRMASFFLKNLGELAGLTAHEKIDR